MEMEGLIRVVESLGDLVNKTLVTDRHRSIAKYIRETMPNVAHLFDVWHVSKGIQYSYSLIHALFSISFVLNFQYFAYSDPEEDRGRCQEAGM